MYLKLIRKHKPTFAILLFIIFFSFFHYLKPGFAYDKQGAFRPFGLGYRHKTVVPIWIVAILLAIFSYVVVVAQ